MPVCIMSAHSSEGQAGGEVQHRCQSVVIVFAHYYCPVVLIRFEVIDYNALTISRNSASVRTSTFGVKGLNTVASIILLLIICFFVPN